MTAPSALHDADRRAPARDCAAARRRAARGLCTESTLQTDIGRLEVVAAEARIRPSTIEDAGRPAATDPVSPRPTLTIVGALVAGLVLGIAGAFAVADARSSASPRGAASQPLPAADPGPGPARVESRRGRPLGPGAPVAPGARGVPDAARQRHRGTPQPQAAHSVLVTGSSPSEGKTTTAINLAGSLALAGNRVILIEADLRRPAIADALGIISRKGVVSTLLENISMDEALRDDGSFGPSLELLLADYKGGWMSELFSLHAAQRLLAAAKARADYVIVDSPPLTTVVDTLPLARQVDDVLIVTRLGTTRIDKLPELAELLASNGITPLGFALIGTERTRELLLLRGRRRGHRAPRRLSRWPRRARA